jgi:hypothetical protein
MTTAPAISPEQGAIDRSREQDPELGRTSKLRPGEYQVLGNTGWWVVRVDADGYTCDCPGGQHGRKCWHMGSAYRLRLSCRSLRPAAPAPTPAPAPKLTAREELFGAGSHR